MRRPLQYLAWFIVLIAWLLCGGFLAARADPIVRRVTLEVGQWPAATPPVRVALLGDIHLGNATMDVGRLGRIVAQVNALKPDLVIIAGDFVAGSDPHEAARSAAMLVTPLRGLKAPLGVVATLGNHDEVSDPDAINAALGRAGVTVLLNSVSVRGPLLIGGLGDYITGHRNVAMMLAAMRGLNGVPVVVSHEPILNKRLPDDLTLLLTAHTHCGQITLPFVGPVQNIVPPRYMCGLVRDGGRTTIVTGGLGTSVLPMRVGAPPDLWLLTIGPAGQGSSRARS